MLVRSLSSIKIIKIYILCTASSCTDQCRVSAGCCSSPAAEIYGPAGQVLHAATEDHQKERRGNQSKNCHDPGVS